MKYSVVTFGCRVNQADSLALEESLRRAGATDAPAAEADLIIVNSCSVTASADQGTRQTIRRLARENPAARMVVTGCYASRSAEEVARLPGVSRVIHNDDKPRLLAVLGLGPRRYDDGAGACGAPLEPGLAGRTAFTLGVQTGCAEPCSYCIIPSTRGTPRSLPLAVVLGEIERIVSAGFKEIALTGVHLGSYGRDLTPESSLTDLLRAIANHPLPAAVRFRVSSLEPMDCTPAIVELIAGSDRFAPHFHLPLQHASNSVLGRMQRPYTINYYARLVDSIRARLPDASIGSDVIVGFPGESDEEFAELAQYLPASPLTHVHVFPYSDRPGTAASRMTARVAGPEVRDRGRLLRDISAALSRKFLESQLGMVQRSLTIDDGTVVVTGNYLKLRIAEGLPRNEWVSVRLVSHQHGELLGRGFSLTLDEQLPAGRTDIAAAALSH